MTTPFRAVDQLSGQVVPPPTDLAEQYCRTIALGNGITDPGTMAVTVREIDRLQADLTAARADADNLRGLLAAANRHNADLSATVDRYGLEILDLRDSCAEQTVRVQELEGELAEAKRETAWLTSRAVSAESACDTANAKASL